MAICDIKIKIQTKKIISIIIPRIGGIIFYRVTMFLRGKIIFYLWAFGTPYKIWVGRSR